MFSVYNSYFDSIVSIITQPHLSSIAFPAFEFSTAVGWNNKETLEYIRNIANSFQITQIYVGPDSTDVYLMYETYLLQYQSVIPGIQKVLDAISPLKLECDSFSIIDFFHIFISSIFSVFLSQVNAESRAFLKTDLETAGCAFRKEWSVKIGNWIRSDPFNTKVIYSTPNKVQKMHNGQPIHFSENKASTGVENAKKRMLKAMSSAMLTVNASKSLADK